MTDLYIPVGSIIIWVLIECHNFVKFSLTVLQQSATFLNILRLKISLSDRLIEMRGSSLKYAKAKNSTKCKIHLTRYMCCQLTFNLQQTFKMAGKSAFVVESVVLLFKIININFANF